MKRSDLSPQWEGLGKKVERPTLVQPEWVEAPELGKHWWVSTDGLNRKKYAPPEPAPWSYP